MAKKGARGRILSGRKCLSLKATSKLTLIPIAVMTIAGPAQASDKPRPEAKDEPSCQSSLINENARAGQVLRKLENFSWSQEAVIVQVRNLVGTLTGQVENLREDNGYMVFDIVGAMGRQTLPVTEDLMVIPVTGGESEPLLQSPLMERSYDQLKVARADRVRVKLSSELLTGALVGEVDALYVKDHNVHFVLHGPFGYRPFRLDSFMKIEALPSGR